MSMCALRRAMACAVLAVGVAPVVVGGTASLRGSQAPHFAGTFEQTHLMAPQAPRPVGMLGQAQPLEQQAPTMRTLLALDTNQDGKVDMSEIAAFARAQGLDAEASTAEFSGLDTDGDGVLSGSEITMALGGSSVQIASGETAFLRDPAGVAPATVPVHVAPTVPVMPLHPTPFAAEPLGTAPLGVPAVMAQDGPAAIIVKDLKLGQSAESEAQQLERKSADLRENAMALARATSEQALEAATTASANKANELMKKAQELLEQATNTEVEAAKARTLAQEAGIRASAFMEVADGALAETIP